MDNFLDGKKGGDELEQRIIERLGSRQRKIDRMKEWESGRRRNLRPLYVAVSAAACIALAVVLTNPFQESGNIIEELGIEAPCMSAYRSAVPEFVEIEPLMSAGRYYEAIDVAYAALKRSDKAVKELQKQAAWGDEEWEYELNGERLMNAELRWVYIYLLVISDCDRNAVRELKKYLENDGFCLHKAEAESMLRALS